MLDLMSNDSRYNYNFYGEEIRDGIIKSKKMIKLWGYLFEDGWLMQVEENANSDIFCENPSPRTAVKAILHKQIKIENLTFNR